MVSRCKFRGRRGILWHVLKIDGSRAQNIDFEVANFQVLRKTRRKTSILKLQSAKIGGGLVRNARFGAIDVSRLESLVFPWLRRVYGGSCKTCPFVMLPIVKIAGSLVRNDRFGAPTCLVSSLWFSCGFAVSMGEAGKHLLFECVQAGCHVVLRGRRGTLWHSNLFDNVSKISQLEEVSHEMFVLVLPRVVSSLWFSCGVAVSMGEAPHSTLYTLHSTLHNLHFRLHTLHFTLHTLHFALYTPHSSPETLHSTLHTLHYTLHFPLLAPHSTLYTPHSTLYTPHSKLYTPHSTLYTPHSIL